MPKGNGQNNNEEEKDIETVSVNNSEADEEEEKTEEEIETKRRSLKSRRMKMISLNTRILMHGASTSGKRTLRRTIMQILPAHMLLTL